MSEEEKVEMEYRLLGNTGLKVSAVGFGYWATFGVKEGVDRCVSIMRICRKAGVNFFDNAEAYGKKHGDAETIMGEALRVLQKEDPVLWRRSDICLTTKIFWGGSGVNECGLSRKHMLEGCDASLTRLGLDYVDVIFAHRPDEKTPTEEVVRAFTKIVNDGKAIYWGTSEWSAQQITEAYWIAKTENLIPPSCEQTEYNMFKRDKIEKEYRRLYKAPYNIGSTIWGPLKAGILTGKYNKGIPKDSRYATYEWMAKRFDKEKIELIPKVEKLMELATKLDTSVAVLAIAWCLTNTKDRQSMVLLGATKEHQIEENLKAFQLYQKGISEETMAEIDEILGNKPADTPLWGR